MHSLYQSAEKFSIILYSVVAVMVTSTVYVPVGWNLFDPISEPKKMDCVSPLTFDSVDF